ncbi:hypothetical protein M8009_03795 [Halomonas sp. ATCH28]|uniref:Uncharacterized protein n=1 Tax=Halomonas gemina TaxID=2945105 RepID=A0ABT0SXY1_9GAMM|nr:hypothetical protein [Halomonas gemina]MCL7939428.1 hypothetical protein [Halomonas gemina]
MRIADSQVRWVALFESIISQANTDALGKGVAGAEPRHEASTGQLDDPFRELGVEDMRAWGKPMHVLYDLKYALPKAEVHIRL